MMMIVQNFPTAISIVSAKHCRQTTVTRRPGTFLGPAIIFYRIREMIKLLNSVLIVVLVLVILVVGGDWVLWCHDKTNARMQCVAGFMELKYRLGLYRYSFRDAVPCHPEMIHKSWTSNKYTQNGQSQQRC
jgi:hypothetical protein